MFIAILDTTYFNFMAAGATKEAALTAMCNAWNKHRRQTGAEYTWAQLADGVRVHAFKEGTTYRDGIYFGN